ASASVSLVYFGLLRKISLMRITIREATQEDQTAAGLIRSRVLDSEHPYKYERNIVIPRCANLVAVENDNVIGFVSVLLTRWNVNGERLWERLAPYLAFIGVLPEKENRGVGASLLHAVCGLAARYCLNEPLLFLEHEPENKKAERLYLRAGFRQMTS